MTTIETFTNSNTQANTMIKIKIKTIKATHTAITTKIGSMDNKSKEISTVNKISNKIEIKGPTKDFIRKVTIVTEERKTIKIICMLTNIITKSIGRPLSITTIMREMEKSRATLLRLPIQKINRQISQKLGKIIKTITSINMNTTQNSSTMAKNLMISLIIMRMITKIVHM